MAYNNNQFNGYNGGFMPQNYGYNPNNMYQGYQPTQPQNPQPMNEFKFMTENEIMAYVVNPNCKLYAIDGKNLKFYIKSTDNLGNSNIERYTLTRDDGENPSASAEAPKIDLSAFLTKEDFGKEMSTLKEQVNKKFAELDRIKNAFGGAKTNG